MNKHIAKPITTAIQRKLIDVYCIVCPLIFDDPYCDNTKTDAWFNFMWLTNMGMMETLNLAGCNVRKQTPFFNPPLNRIIK